MWWTCSPLLFHDWDDNRERKIRAQIAKCLGDNPGRIRELLVRVPPICVPRPLTPDFMRRVINGVRDRIHQIDRPKGLFLVDTFRSAFSAGKDYNELDALAQALPGQHAYPSRKEARQAARQFAEYDRHELSA